MLDYDDDGEGEDEYYDDNSAGLGENHRKHDLFAFHFTLRTWLLILNESFEICELLW